MDLINRALEVIEIIDMDPIDLLRAFFILAAATTFSVSIPSALRARFLVYGPRATPTPTSESRDANSKPPSASPLLDYLATWQVPHSYFTQFYVASVLSSVFWAFQLAFRGNVFQFIATRLSKEHTEQSMTLTQVLICWILLAIQGSRRLWECYKFAKPSTSQMWVFHWIVGLAFYLGAGIAIWIEGSATVLTRSLTLRDVQMSNAPTLRTFFCVPLFMIASGLQHDCHHFLFSLKKYTLPDHPIFRSVVCPHYGAECVIYLSLAILAAPPGQLVNKSMLACMGFVVVNLGLTARNTKDWYMKKFGREMVQDRWLMIPGIY
ncbi:uncharacterized protein N7483_010946 [Penicillium malachiteum]|uniref:uncharacterized protein n=1 Tax=Penicillium malachiteum TaxID=1324776 RepID=UPI0025479616|nr:uncharacterized protein N7483_010946 [Penicillium malachiteum]KAJ5713765.1 hypothetical protein N7483_010946 [Penicillium malachiteum]